MKWIVRLLLRCDLYVEVVRCSLDGFLVFLSRFKMEMSCTPRYLDQLFVRKTEKAEIDHDHQFPARDGVSSLFKHMK